MEEIDLIVKIKKIKPLNLAFIGHMGSGKTLFGKLIANKLNINHLDSDNLIEEDKNKKINEIFDIEGESSFRNIEEKIILNLANKNNLVLSLGGGSILSSKVRNFLKQKFITLFLDIDISVLKQRLKNTTKRPLLKKVNIEKKIKELDKTRRKYYKKSDIIIKENKDPQVMINQILNDLIKLNEKNNSN